MFDKNMPFSKKKQAHLLMLQHFHHFLILGKSCCYYLCQHHPIICPLPNLETSICLVTLLHAVLLHLDNGGSLQKSFAIHQALLHQHLHLQHQQKHRYTKNRAWPMKVYKGSLQKCNNLVVTVCDCCWVGGISKI